MITVEYLPNRSETINVTLDFLNRRPIVKITLVIAKICVFFMCIAGFLKALTKTLTIHDLVVWVFALIWLFGYRSINSIFLRNILTKSKTNSANYIFHINKDKLWKQNNTNAAAMQQPWKQVKYIYKNQHGYIIPSIGYTNAGKFVWLPKRGFNNIEAENKFLEILQHHKIIIK